MSNIEKILISTTIPLPEVEEDFDRDLVATAKIRADMLDIINHVGLGKKCRNIIYLLKDTILFQNIANLKVFCNELFDKIKVVYDYEPPVFYDILDRNEVKEMFEFLEFLEFSCCDFIYEYLKKIDNVPKSIYETEIEIISLHLKFDELKIEECISMLNMSNKIIIDFLTTNSKENLLKFISSKIKENIDEIFLLSLIEKKGEIQNDNDHEGS